MAATMTPSAPSHTGHSQMGHTHSQVGRPTQEAQQHSEGSVARTIEQQTAKLPSDLFLWAALGSIGISLMLRISGNERDANFVGHWAPTFLILGLYNKIVKVAGSDRVSS